LETPPSNLVTAIVVYEPLKGAARIGTPSHGPSHEGRHPVALYSNNTPPTTQ
jgi:hypothetical protein